MGNELSQLTTEQRNENSMHLDEMSTREILQTINDEDKKIAVAVEKVLPAVEEAVEHVHEAFLKGGRLFLVGAGTSGRLAVLDASECMPTFMSPPELVQAVMAGGSNAFFEAAESNEDDESQGETELKRRRVTANDVVIGIAASGRTPFVAGALKYARGIGATTVSLTCNRNSVISEHADCKIEVVVGPEILTGSTRMKAGTAHKMVLNMISTTAMVKMGKVYENLMIDVHASNHKLRERAKRILTDITGISPDDAAEVLKKSHQQVKPAVVMIEAGVSYEDAVEEIRNHNGNVRKAIASAKGR
ncbi:MAG TPA: N-acetylmuramic acid 6-phosphate etherase [Bacillales bacterium]|jgi:N-acetylmuramic acid 6-phosphate etherase|nr:N-acetylmuramic acid 6-phosphate etherase [Bacillales bacterium]